MILIVPLAEEHLDAVTELEERNGDVHWSRIQFEKELSSEVGRFFVMVENDSGEVVGYGGYWKAGPEAQITNLVIRQEFRQQGLGRRLMEFLLDCARGEECLTCTLEVRQGNLPAQSLYKDMEFQSTGLRPKVYQNPEDDAVLMEKKL